MTAVQELLGDSSIVMTMRYAHLAPEASAKTVRLLDGSSSEWAELVDDARESRREAPHGV